MTFLIFLLYKAFAYAVDFITESDINDQSKWQQISIENPGVFYRDFFISTSVPVIEFPGAVALRTDDINVSKTPAKNNNRFFNFNGFTNDIVNIVTLNNIILQGGICDMPGGAVYLMEQLFSWNAYNWR